MAKTPARNYPSEYLNGKRTDVGVVISAAIASALEPTGDPLDDPGDTDLPNLETLPTDETDTTLVPRPDGVGGVVWGPGSSVPDGTALGDLLVWDGSAWQLLPVGPDDDVLTADSGEALGVKWATPASGGGGGSTVGVRATRSSTQSIGDSAFVAIILDAVDWDDAGLWSAGDPTKLTVPTGEGGRWHVDAGSGAWDGNTTGIRQLYLRTNVSGVTEYRRADQRGPQTSGVANTLGDDIFLDDGDFVEAVVFQNSGGSRTVAGNTGAWLTMHRI